MRPLTVGILGGMGPRATVVFQQRLFDAFRGSDQDLPRIISVNDGSIPDRTNFLNKEGSDPYQALLRSANILKNAGVDIVCMPCNTAHAPQILGRLQGNLALPIIDMPAATLATAETLLAKNLVILGTRGTRLSRVYQSRSINISCKFPNEQQQNQVDKTIELIKLGSLDQVDIQALRNTIEQAGCDAAVLACTELSLLKPQLSTAKTVIIDSMDCLVATCISIVSGYNVQMEIHQ